MDILFEWGILSLVGLLIYGVLSVLVHIYWKWRLRQYDKASADYQRGVEEHQAKMRKESESDSSISD